MGTLFELKENALVLHSYEEREKKNAHANYAFTAVRVICLGSSDEYPQNAL